MKLLPIILIGLVLTMSGCTQPEISYTPDQIKEYTLQFLQKRLGENYVEQYFAFDSIEITHHPDYDTYTAYYIYNFPYPGEKKISVNLKQGFLHFYGNYPLIPYTFNLTEQEARDIASEAGITEITDLRFEDTGENNFFLIVIGNEPSIGVVSLIIDSTTGEIVKTLRSEYQRPDRP